MTVRTLTSSIGVIVQNSIIPGTYTDLWRAKDYLLLAMFDADSLNQKISANAINAKDKINTFLGRTVDFTEEELLLTQFAGIVDAASQLTACYVQKNPQAAAMDYTADTIADCAEAFTTLTNWALNNGIIPPMEKEKHSHILTELVYVYNNPGEVI